MKIAYVGDYINHGNKLSTTGTPLVIMLSTLGQVESIDVFCPILNRIKETGFRSSKVRVIESYSYDNPISLFGLLRLIKDEYDLLVFNLLPTSFGRSSIANFFGLAIPFILQRKLKHRIVIIYHNSVLTNSVEQLGYKGVYNKVRRGILSWIERFIFKEITTYVLLEQYKTTLDLILPNNKVNVLGINFLEAITTIVLNEVENKVSICVDRRKEERPTILLHGYWGPQKNLEKALFALNELYISGLEFNLVISGGFNYNFPSYVSRLNSLMKKYNHLISKYAGYVEEKDLLGLFLSADLLLLPYNAPGGRSGVLEQALFFDIPSIVIDFPEFREQASSSSIVNFCTIDLLEQCIKSLVAQWRVEEKIILIRDKISQVKCQVRNFLENNKQICQ